MDREQQLAWEKKRAPQAAAAAFGGVLLGLGSSVYVASSIKASLSSNVDQVVAYANHPSVFIVSAVIQAVSFLSITGALLYLDKATRFRRPEAPGFTRTLAVVGPLLLGIYGIVRIVIQTGDAKAALPLSDKGGEDFLRDLPGAVVGLGLAGTFALGFAFALVGINAMRAGLLSRFMGYLGVALGVFTGLSALGGIAQGGFLLLFWVAALGLLFLGRWPGKRGPAWEKGEAVPWPSQSQRVQEAQQRGEARHAERADDKAQTADPDTRRPADADGPRPASRKRKRR